MGEGELSPRPRLLRSHPACYILFSVPYFETLPDTGKGDESGWKPVSSVERFREGGARAMPTVCRRLRGLGL